MIQTTVDSIKEPQWHGLFFRQNHITNNKQLAIDYFR